MRDLAACVLDDGVEHESQSFKDCRRFSETICAVRSADLLRTKSGAEERSQIASPVNHADNLDGFPLPNLADNIRVKVLEAIAAVETLVVEVTGGRRLSQSLEGLIKLRAEALGGVRAVLGNVEEDLTKVGGRLGSEYEAPLHERCAFFPARDRS